MKKLALLALLVIGLIGLTSCPGPYNKVEATWLKINIYNHSVNSYTTYDYSQGVLVSWVWHGKLLITGDESGEIKITASAPSNKETCISFVESGREYEVTVKGSMSSGGSDCEIFIESPSFETREIKTDFATHIQTVHIEDW